MNRPQRTRIIREDGGLQTLADGPEAFACYGEGSDALILGLGVDPLDACRCLARLACDCGVIRYLECPDFARQMPPEWHNAIPAHWIAISPDMLTPGMASASSILEYKQGRRLFPSFWGPAIGKVQAAQIGKNSSQHPSRTVLLPGTPRSLLVPELEAALAAEGFHPLCIAPENLDRLLPRILSDERPAFVLSVNLQGLDAAGERFRLLQACDIPVVLWCVDNPWHLLSALRTPWWREVHLCVTDASFIPSLRAYGAASVHHLPLGTWPELFAPADVTSGHSMPERCAHGSEVSRGNTPGTHRPEGHIPLSGKPSTRAEARPAPSQDACALPPDSSLTSDSGLTPASGLPPAASRSDSPTIESVAPVLFVGRSTFPQRDRFFAGCSVQQPDMDAASALLDTQPHGVTAVPGAVPDFHWWTRKLGNPSLWPGAAVRQIGYATELCSLLRRRNCLQATLEHGLTAVGDAAWRDLVPGLKDLRAPVDYYGSLRHYYAAARWTLNVTSLLLPAGLTQRNFDVWMAGGFCISDATPGLELFPGELTSETSFACAAELSPLIRRLDDTGLRAHIVDAWKKHIIENHTYRHRIQTILSIIKTA